ncbi:MAG: ribosome maturation factor RimP [Elusimicrobiota bacterium]|nr:ribosome maturation factor RimP [Elusimicrobiota bacterium]
MSVKEDIEKLIEPLLEDEGFELVDIEYRNKPHQGMTLTIYVDKKLEGNSVGDRGSDSGGNIASSVTLKDCELVSEKISFLLDKEGIINCSYSLEVSSPGLYRRLKKEKDFYKFIGKRIRVSTYQPLVSSQRNFIGFIENCENNILSLRTVDNKLLQIDLSQIAIANLEPEIKF